ncbi:unnamed protein product [Cylindrotheca closterium]|uniref:Golgin-84 n=1 Tax=Cylindrotheca closterium TaxID=2856 RepID=A0AAD2JI55_9STRA|nr:unnamed protein product [Cylindrotheca closterium]
MSKWLSSVNNLLEKLDDTAEAVAEERRATGEEDTLSPAPAIEEILAKRGLADDGDEKQVQAVQRDDVDAIELDDFGAFDDFDNDVLGDKAGSVPEQGESRSNENLETPTDDTPNSENYESDPEPNEEEELKSKGEEDKFFIAIVPEKQDKGGALAQSAETRHDNRTEGVKESSEPKASKVPTIPPKSAPAKASKPGREKELVMEAKEAQKEARTLRRHVVSLNSQLESAEIELQAQRKELERAAEQMEKDRIRTKEAKEVAMKIHTNELEALRSQHDKALKEQQARFEQQVDSYRNKLTDMKSQKKQEDGDWSKEMTSVVKREKELNQQVMSLEDEKVTLLSQISTLQGQQEALGSRLESLTQAADNAADREHEAEDRLDNALTQHARQISQRQAREAELERTVQELNAALVAKARNGAVPRSQQSNNRMSGETEDTSLSVRMETLQNEYDTAAAHLALEKEKSEALQIQLREMSKESTQEASASHAMQLQYDRKVADLQLTVSKLQHEKTQKDTNGLDASGTGTIQDDHTMSTQVKVLSEQLMNLREKITNQSSENSALKNRLQIAIDRAQEAEDQLAIISCTGANGDYDSVEKGNLQPGLGRRRKGKTPNSGSIRTAMLLNTGQGERTEQIGKVVDVVDSFAVTTGKYLRRNPIARAGFIFYLVLIHLWTFVLLFVHAHSFDTVGDNTQGTSLRVVHGPGALMQKDPGQGASP